MHILFCTRNGFFFSEKLSQLYRAYVDALFYYNLSIYHKYHQVTLYYKGIMTWVPTLKIIHKRIEVIKSALRLQCLCATWGLVQSNGRSYGKKKKKSYLESPTKQNGYLETAYVLSISRKSWVWQCRSLSPCLSCFRWYQQSQTPVWYLCLLSCYDRPYISHTALMDSLMDHWKTLSELRRNN